MISQNPKRKTQNLVLKIKAPWFCVAVLILAFFISADKVVAGGASLYFSPTTGTFYVGSTFDVSIFLNTGGNDVNAVKVDLKFDPKKIQIASPTAGKSFISVWVAQPSFSNMDGTASFQGGIPSPGINTSSGLVSTITFRVIAPGQSTITFLNSSQVLLDDGKGTNILSSLSRGSYQLTIPPPEGPKIFSETHSDQNKWHNSNSPTFSWEKESQITDFSYVIDQNFYSVPDEVSEGSNSAVSFSGLEDGVWYFHLKAKKGDVWGGTSNYVIMIDNTPPAVFGISFEPQARAKNVITGEPVLYFTTTDNLSGIDHYALKLIDLTNSIAQEVTGFFIEASSPYKIPSLSAGQYRVVVRAFDSAMNYRDASEKFETVPSETKFFISDRGIYLLPFFLPWGWTIFILAILIIVVGAAIFAVNIKHKKIRSQLHRGNKILSGLKEKIKEREENIKKRMPPESKI